MIASQNSFVYISYDPSDESWKETIASRLRESDMQVHYAAPNSSGIERLLFAKDIRANSRVFLLLVSPRFLKSDDIFKAEYPQIRSLVDSGRAQIIFVVIETCPWRSQLTSPAVPSIVVPTEDRPLIEEDSEQLKNDLDTLVREIYLAFQRTDVPVAANRESELSPASDQTEELPSQALADSDFALGAVQSVATDSDDQEVAPTANDPSMGTSSVANLEFTDRCQRVLVAAARYNRNRQQPQPNSLTTSPILYALIDFALLNKIDADDATHVIGTAIREAGVDRYHSRRRKFLKQAVPVTVFDHEPLTEALASVSTNTRTLLEQAQAIARETTMALTVSSNSPAASIDTRHLIGAMLTAFPQGKRISGQRQLMSFLGLQVQSLKESLYSFVSEHYLSSDLLDKWLAVLQVLPTTVPDGIKGKTLEVFEPLIAGYVSDSTKSATDDLGIGRDVQTLSSVILARDVAPPLSIGLFGDWGTGKTFFMDQMREEIDFVTKRANDSGYSKFHTQVAQITFNAWHYVDANLWASLVSHILEKLVEVIAPERGDTEVRKNLVKELQTAKELKAEAEQEKLRAAEDRKAVEERLNALAQQRAEKQVELSSLRTADLWQFVQNDKDLRKSIETALNSLGLPAVLNSLEDLDSIASETRGLGGRAYALCVSLVRERSWPTLLALMGILLFAVPGLAWCLSRWWPHQPFVTTVSSIGTGISAICLAISSAVREPLRKVNEYVKQLEEARTKALSLINEKRNERNDQETRLEGEVNALKAKELSATQQLSAADARIREVESKIHEIDEGRNLAKFILARSEAGDYRRHLGLISTIRHDFENLSKLLQIASNQDSDTKSIQRIVLYVDDLDRCPSARVVELLEAVHLLLAFDLFVVVVGVDPRWLLHSLREKFSAFQNGADKPSSEQLEWVTTPQDYLEKIFQIPFSLRRMEPAGFSALMQRLLHETAAQTVEVPAPAQPVEVSAPDTTIGQSEASQQTPINAVSRPAIANTAPIDSPSTVVPPRMNRQLNENSLNIKSWEGEYATQLSAFIQTPRSAKRFTNIYRLLKAPLGRDELLRFEGQKTSPGEFRAAMILLAILTGFPNESVSLFEAILEQNAQSFSPQEFFGNITKHSITGPEVQRLQSCFTPLLKAALPDSSDPFVRWVPRVARFSFYTTKVADLKA